MASKVGFVGLDEYSVDMAASLIRSGYKVQAFEVYDSLVDKFLQLGGIRCASPMEAGKDVSALVVVLSHVGQIDDIFCGHEGVFKGLQKGTIIILRSTILPLHIQKLEKTLTEVDETACVVDAYVSRGMSEIFNGKLMITSSGRSYAIVRARPLLSAMCEKLYVFEDDVGAGSKVKMVNEHLQGIHLLASVEAISLGVQFRIHPWILYDIISNAAGNSWVFKNHIPELLRGNAKLHFLNAFIQNLGIALDMAKALIFPLPLLAVAHQQLILGLSHAHGNDDNSPLVKVWEKVLGVSITDAADSEAYDPEELAKQIIVKSNTVTRVGFIGLGAMGFGMATHLLRSNFTVVGYDVYRPTLTKFENAGGLIANSPEEVVKDVGVLVIMVTNEAQAESVLYGDFGAVPALSSGTSIVLSSTVSPGFVSQLERRLQLSGVQFHSLCQELFKGIASGLASKGFKAVTFDMRGVGRSTGKASLTGFAEVKDVIAICQWVSDNLSTNRILLVGSSAGAPIAGSAVDEIEQVVGYVSLGYPFGMIASVLFGRHHKAILKSPKAKLFVMGTRDGFTSVKQLQNKLSYAAGRVEIQLIEGASHFQMEGPAFDARMVNLIHDFIASL